MDILWILVVEVWMLKVTAREDSRPTVLAFIQTRYEYCRPNKFA
jgi:hypothetical protein